MSALKLREKSTLTHIVSSRSVQCISLSTTGGYKESIKGGGPETAPDLLSAAADCCPGQVVAHIDFTECCDTENDMHGNVALIVPVTMASTNPRKPSHELPAHACNCPCM